MIRYTCPLRPAAHNVVCCPGEKIKDRYVLDVSPNGEEKLICVGSIDISEEINSHRSACDLATILQRHEMMGTLGTLSHTGHGLVDLTGIPNNLQEMKMYLDKADKLYNSLKPEVKEKFENIEAFLSVFGSVPALHSFLLQTRQGTVHGKAQAAKDGGEEA